MIITRRNWCHNCCLFPGPSVFSLFFHVTPRTTCDNSASDPPSSLENACEFVSTTSSHQNPTQNFQSSDLSFEEDNENARQIRLVISRVHDGKVEDIVQSLQRDQACGKMQVSERLVVNLLQRFGDDWKSALGFFHWVVSRFDYMHTTRAYNKMVDILGKMKQTEKMSKLVNEMQMRGLVTTETIAKIMRRLVGSGRWKDALKIFDDLESMGLKKDTEIMNVLLDTLCKENQVEAAREIFLKLKTHISPDAYTFNIFVHGWCKVRRLDEAEWTILEMKGYGIHPSVITFSTILQAYSNQSNLRKVYELLNRMKDEGCPPNIVTYTSVMLAFAKSQQTKAVYEIIGRVMKSGCKPDVVFYNSLINMLGRAGHLSDVSCIYNIEMCENGVSPNLSTYNTLVLVYCLHSLEEYALEILKEMEAAHCKPDLISYTPLLKLCLKRGKTDDRLGCLLDDMVNKHHLSLDSSTYTLMIHGLCRAEKLEWALCLFEEMVQREIPSRKRTCNFLLEEADQKGLYNTVEKINVLMKK